MNLPKVRLDPIEFKTRIAWVAGVFNKAKVLSQRVDLEGDKNEWSVGLGSAPVTTEPNSIFIRNKQVPFTEFGFCSRHHRETVQRYGLRPIKIWRRPSQEEIDELQNRVTWRDLSNLKSRDNFLIFAGSFRMAQAIAIQAREEIWDHDEETSFGMPTPLLWMPEIYEHLDEDGTECLRLLAAYRGFMPNRTLILPAGAENFREGGLWREDNRTTEEKEADAAIDVAETDRTPDA